MWFTIFPAHARTETRYLQIDAAINPGNSGGPAFANLSSSEVVGVAFSRHKQAEATGYIIPYIVVQHFLESFKRRGLFSGLCCLGMLVNRLENPSLRRFHKVCSFLCLSKVTGDSLSCFPPGCRRVFIPSCLELHRLVPDSLAWLSNLFIRVFMQYHRQLISKRCLGLVCFEKGSSQRFMKPPHLQLSKDQSGAVIKKISPLACALSVLSVNDVITHINGRPVADDCTLTLRHDERISMMHAIRASHIGDEVQLDILRDGQPSRVSYTLSHCLYKVPGLHGVDCWPSYYIYGAHCAVLLCCDAKQFLIFCI